MAPRYSNAFGVDGPKWHRQNKYSKIDQKTFDNILELILEMKNREKLSLLEKNMFKNKLYSIRLGK